MTFALPHAAHSVSGGRQTARASGVPLMAPRRLPAFAVVLCCIVLHSIACRLHLARLNGVHVVPVDTSGGGDGLSAVIITLLTHVNALPAATEERLSRGQ